MAKLFFLLATVLIAAASARNAGFQRQNGNYQPMGNGRQQGNGSGGQQIGFPFPGNRGGLPGSQAGFPKAQGGFSGNQEEFPGSQGRIPEIQGGFPGSQGRFPGNQGGFPGSQGDFPQGEKGFPGHQGGHGFPGQHGRGGHGHGHHLPPFLSNVTKEALEELHSIMTNENLTKTELEAQMESWTQAQGEEIAQKFAEMREEHKQKEEAAKEKANEMLTAVTELLPKIEAIKSNMEITKAAEHEQIAALFSEVSPSVMNLLKMLGKEATKETMTPPEVPEMPGVPEVPEAADFGTFSGFGKMF